MNIWLLTFMVKQITYFDNHSYKVNHSLYSKSFACNTSSSFYIINGHCYSIDFDNSIRFQSIVATRSQLFWETMECILGLSESQLSIIRKLVVCGNCHLTDFNKFPRFLIKSIVVIQVDGQLKGKKVPQMVRTPQTGLIAINC